MLRVYGDVYSGNCYKLKLLMNQLDIKHEWISIDLLKQETRTPEFLAKNPNGKVPVLELTNGVFLVESNAILHYLADGTPLLPHGKFQHAQVLQWLFFEQYSHEPYVAVARFIIRYLGRPAEGRHTPVKNGAGLQGAGCHGKASEWSSLLCRRSLHHCRHCAVCLHPCGA